MSHQVLPKWAASFKKSFSSKFQRGHGRPTLHGGTRGPSRSHNPSSPRTSTPAQNLNNPETIKKTLEHESLALKRLKPDKEAPLLSYGLDRVLFNPGVHWLRDLRTNVYNFDPFLKDIPSAEVFNFNSVPEFIPASKDTSLHRLAAQQECSFVTSTSSISQSMGVIYFVLSKMKPLNLEGMSQYFAEEPKTFTMLTRAPTTVILRPHGPNLRSILVEKLKEPENVLQKLGQVMERLLTEPKDNFMKMLKTSAEPPHIRDSEAYAFTAAGKILLRSQLDCQDPRLPRKTFDLKTRAVLPVRMDVKNYENYRDYRIVANSGLYSSYEREYFDMCRSAFLKYKIGDMDGIFVAYHNAFEIFGFQYVSRDEMDERIYGNSATGDASFSLILQVYNELLAAIVPLYPKEHAIRLSFSADRAGQKLTVFAEDAGRDESQQGVQVRQFNVSLGSILNGFRTENVLLDPRGTDDWKVNMSITMSPTSITEYDSVRAKATAVRGDPEDNRGSNLLRIMKEASSSPAASSHGPNILAPWTIL